MADWLARRPPSLRKGSVDLEPLDGFFLDPYLEMLADPEVGRLTGPAPKFTRERIVEWLTTRPLAEGRLDWAIRESKLGEFVGEIVLNEYELKDNSMNLRIALRGPQYFNHGYGSDAIEAVLIFAFDKLKLRRVRLSVWVENPRAISTYEKFGFQPKRQYSEDGYRWQRMVVEKADLIRALAERKIAEHLDLENWKFEFDSAKRRAGLCNYTEQKIQLSKYHVDIHSVDENMQVVLHEVAHAMAGSEAAHSKVWLATAKRIGYRAEKFTGKEIAQETAPWIGDCPMGHKHYRYRRPKQMVSCALCTKNFDSRYIIRWRKREG
ncbi:MAG: SprT-like domain-containing protein [Rhodoluna sp.]|nr:SprT-like domain-containing protein [Rhodoluna sp.]MBP6186554.1 SprT-like domain-containing protein [Rhodoluna sp.]